MKSIDEIVSSIKENEESIINNLSYESIMVYKFIMKEFKATNIIDNYLFRFVYSNFYRLDNAKLGEEFKSGYFRIMEENKRKLELEPRKIVLKLYKYKRLKGDNSIQFSFTTKMMHTVNPKYPIYDSMVTKALGFSIPYNKDIKKKVDKYINQYKEISEVYKIILKDDLMKTTFDLFDKRFGEDINDLKKLDFIIWSFGKLINKGMIT